MIKMRHNKDGNAKCYNCGISAQDVLDMFDLKIGNVVVTICDMCNEQLLQKTLTAEVRKNQRTKSPRDVAIIHKRSRDRFNALYGTNNNEKDAK